MSTETRQVPERKVELRERLVGLLEESRGLIIADLQKTNTRLLNEIRNRERELGVKLKVTRNTIFRIALKEFSEGVYEELEELVDGQVLLIFTEGDPIVSAIRLSKIRVDVPAKAGYTATSDIWVEKGNTGFPPGPIIGLFGAAGVPTRIQSGSIHITEDVKVAEEGDVISRQVANVLGKLKMTPISTSLDLEVGYDLYDETLIQEENLLPDVQKYEGQVELASQHAFKVALETAYPDPRVLPLVLRRAHGQVRKLAVEGGYVSEETIEELLSRAAASARSLQSKTEEID